MAEVGSAWGMDNNDVVNTKVHPEQFPAYREGEVQGDCEICPGCVYQPFCCQLCGVFPYTNQFPNSPASS